MLLSKDHTWWSSGRVLAWCAGGCGFESRLGHTTDFKNGTWCLAFKGYTKEIWSVYLLLTVKCDQVRCYINMPAV